MKSKHDIEVAILTSRLEQTETLYQQLLKRMDVLATTSTGSGSQDPFLELYRMARDADKTLPTYQREDYHGTYYWTKEEWHREYQNGRGVLTVKKSSKSGATNYLVAEDGIVASESEQQKMRNQLHAAWRTLLDQGLAPTTWMAADIRALEFIRFTMRQSFIHFRLCDGYWKIDTFASRHYPQWTSRPKEDHHRVKVKREKVDAVNVKVEQVTQDSISAALPSGTSKRPQSIAISPQVRISKKMKEAHLIPSPPVFTANHHDACLVAETTRIDAMSDKPTCEHISDDPVAFEPSPLDEPINLTSSDANVQLSRTATVVGPPRLEVQESLFCCCMTWI